MTTQTCADTPANRSAPAQHAKTTRLSARWTVEVGGLQRVARHASLLRRANSEPAAVRDDSRALEVCSVDEGSYPLMDVIRQLF